MKFTAFDEMVPSESQPERTHRIAGWIFCDCTGFATHGYCKHLRRKMAELLAPKAKVSA